MKARFNVPLRTNLPTWLGIELTTDIMWTNWAIDHTSGLVQLLPFSMLCSHLDLVKTSEVPINVLVERKIRFIVWTCFLFLSIFYFLEYLVMNKRLEQQQKLVIRPFLICSYNGFLPQGDRGRRRSKFVLYKRQEANGVKRSKHYVVKTPHSSQAILDAKQHSISYTLSRNHAVIVEYTPDEETDMFQVCMNIK